MLHIYIGPVAVPGGGAFPYLLIVPGIQITTYPTAPNDNVTCKAGGRDNNVYEKAYCRLCYAQLCLSPCFVADNGSYYYLELCWWWTTDLNT